MTQMNDERLNNTYMSQAIDCLFDRLKTIGLMDWEDTLTYSTEDVVTDMARFINNTKSCIPNRFKPKVVIENFTPNPFLENKGKHWVTIL